MTIRPAGDVRDPVVRAYVERSLARVRALRDGDDAMLRDFLDRGSPLLLARAPGRLDVMGGIADYSGSLVLQLPLEVATTAVLQPLAERTIELVSLRRRISYFMLFRLGLLAVFTLVASYTTWLVEERAIGLRDWLMWGALATGYLLTLI